MGYSCTVDANNTLGVIEHMFATDGNPNVLTIRGEQYFFERGREQEDGAITGQLMRMLPGEYCERAGAVRIAADGEIIRFPALSRAEKQEAMNTVRDMSARNPQLLRRWATGIL